MTRSAWIGLLAIGLSVSACEPSVGQGSESPASEDFELAQEDEAEADDSSIADEQLVDGEADYEVGTAGGPLDYSSSSVSVDDQDRPASEFDEDSARSDAEREVHRRGYQGWCSQDCSGHEAGFEWAHDKGLQRVRPTYDSSSFDEGQEAYVKAVEEELEEKRQQFEDEGADSEYAL